MARPDILFLDDFDMPAASRPDPEVIEPSFTAAELAAAREQAWADGREKALREAAEQHEAALRASADKVAAQLESLVRDLRQDAEQRAEALADLLLEMLAVLFPTLCAAHGEQEALALVKALMPGLARMPAVTIRANPRFAGKLAREIERGDLMDPAAITVVPTDSIPPGDVRLLWADGGASRDAAEAWRRVSRVLAEAGFALPEPLGQEFDPKELDHAA